MNDSTTLPFHSNRSPVLGLRGMVASSQPLATEAGLQILRQGGNAADAAVATAAALNVTEPNMTGIGGDVFSLYYDARSGEVSALNGSGRTPKGLTIERLAGDGISDKIPLCHAHSITVPGACAGWFDLTARHGRLTMRDILAPAIRLAEDGFPVAPITARLWSASLGQVQRSPGGAALMIEGRGPRPGEIFRNPGLAGTFQRIAEGGAEAFYQGEVAEAIVSLVRSYGGTLCEEDLALHESTWDQPISTVYRGLRLWECPPNGQGLAALLALNILRGMNLEDQDPLGAQRFHLMIEAMRLAFEDARWYVADPRHATTPRIPLEELLSENYAISRRRLIDPGRAARDPKRGAPSASSDTVYLCCVDGDGNACSFINSNYMAFGSGLSPVGFGFTLQNRAQQMRLDPSHPDAVAPRKRPYHTIIPALLTRESDGSLYGPMGVMGGFMQPQGHLQVTVAMADDDRDPQAALDRPRFGLMAGRGAGTVSVECGLPMATRTALSAMGHDLQNVEGLARIQFGRGQIIRRDSNGVLWGGSDPRADGCAMAL
jgi:gamma-glutamyltranspeptidase/glutathione hydrolase